MFASTWSCFSLVMIDQVLVHQQVELLEAILGFETNNRYVVKNSVGQQVYFAAERTDCCTRQCCGPLRPFEIQVTDNAGQEVLHLHRPLRCGSCCCPCCLQSSPISARFPTTAHSAPRYPHVSRQPLAQLPDIRTFPPTTAHPARLSSPTARVNSVVLAKDGETEVGKITKQWTGLVREAFTDAENFGVQFPMDLDVKIKATLLGACFLIDFMFFEHNK
ncbi:unnamed protein product [Lampetra fluviatilis]